MEDEAILLKIKRQFSEKESVAALLKIISDLRIEIGILNSDVAELKSENHKLRNKTEVEEGKTKKVWLKDELIGEMQKQIKAQATTNKMLSKRNCELENKYFSLMAKTNSHPTPKKL